jgi:hypothetical protein
VLLLAFEFSSQYIQLPLSASILKTFLAMPKINQSLDAEQAVFDNAVKEIEEWWSSPRQSRIKR